MKIIHITPGSGDAFYCENCLRDGALVGALRRIGLDAAAVPLYLPLPGGAEAPVFFGAVSAWLRDRHPRLRRAVGAARGLLDSGPVLRWAARMAGSTRAHGLEEMTLSLLRGEAGRQAEEVSRLVAWLEAEGRPDAVHLSNALLLGLAGPIRRLLRTPVVCTLQDEDAWVDAMEPRFARQIWGVLAEKARDADLFLPVSDFYGRAMGARLGVEAERMRTVRPGLPLEGYETARPDPSAPAVGFLSRLSEGMGLGVLAEAFLLLRRNPRFKSLRLCAMGGKTRDDEPFLAGLRRRLAENGALADVRIEDGFVRADRIRFLSGLSALAVPARRPEAFGTYLLEAGAAGVPVVQPRRGAYPEIVECTGGGLLYEEDTAEGLAGALESLLADPPRARALGLKGQGSVRARFSIGRMAEETAEAYAGL